MGYKILTLISQCDEHGDSTNHIMVDDATTLDALLIEMYADEQPEKPLTKALFTDRDLACRAAELLNKAGLN